MVDCLRVIVEGRVQGVGYREFVRRAAVRRDISGWARNLPDGSVEVLVSGDAEQVEALLHDMRVGPPHAVVTEVRIEIAQAQALAGFRVLRAD